MRTPILFFVFSLCFSSLLFSQGTHNISIPHDLSIEQYQNWAVECLNQTKLETAEAICLQILSKDAQNPNAFYYLSIIYIQFKKWEKAEYYIHKFLNLYPDHAEGYNMLYTIYSSQNLFEKAHTNIEKAIQKNPQNNAYKNTLSESQTNIQNRKTSLFCSILFIIVLSILSFFSYNQENQEFTKEKKLSIMNIIWISLSTSYLFYSLFFLLSPTIRSMNEAFLLHEYIGYFTHYVLERDGMESYSLYVFSLSIILFSFLFCLAFQKIKKTSFFTSILFILIIIGSFYIFNISFFPPSSSPTNKIPTLLFLVVGISSLLFIIKKKEWILAIVLVPISFFSPQNWSIGDYQYQLYPAMRLLNGIPWSDINFAYDFLLSAICLPWLVFDWDINTIPLLGQFSTYIFFIGLFLFSKRIFLNKHLAIFFIFTVVIIRLYGNLDYVSTFFAGTPWRLDMWIIVLWLVFWKGPYHWSVAGFLAFLLLFHRNFGVIYTVSYIAYIGTLFLYDIFSTQKQYFIENIKQQIHKYLLLTYQNILILCISLVAVFVIFGSIMPKAALIMTKHGIGMIAISEISFYWYVPPMLSVLFIVLLRIKEKISDAYFKTGIFIIVLAIGHSLYFFGRSHENNIINVSTILLLSFFVLIDIISLIVPLPTKTNTTVSSSHKKIEKQKIKTNSSQKFFLQKEHIIPYFYKLIPYCFLLLVCYFYSERITTKISIQIKNMLQFDWKQDFTYYGALHCLNKPCQESYYIDIRSITHNSPKVLFVEYNYFGEGFLLTHLGKYKPTTFYSPMGTALTKKDLALNLQPFLDSGYYMVSSKSNAIAWNEVLPLLDYNAYSEKGYFTTVYKNNTPTLLLEEPKKINSLQFINSQTQRTDPFLPPFITDTSFTIQCIVKPDTEQKNEQATIFSNIRSTIWAEGFTLQSIGKTNQYIFGYGNKQTFVNVASIELTPQEINYIVIRFANKKIDIILNGNNIHSSPYNTDHYNSESLFHIGNNSQKNAAFSGSIYEIQVSNNAITEANIQQNKETINNKIQ